MQISNKKTNAYLLICAVVAFLTGAVAVAGYVFNIPYFYQYNIYAFIKPITAICFLVMGLWMFLSIFRRSAGITLSPFIGVFLVVAAVVKFLERFQVLEIPGEQELIASLPVDEQLFSNISANTALLVLLAGILLLLRRTQRNWAMGIADWLKIIGLLITYLVIIGYIYDIEVRYPAGQRVFISPNSAISFMAFFVFTILGMPHGPVLSVFDSEYIGGSMARKTIPFILVIPLASGYLRLLGETSGLFERVYGTALQSAVMVLVILFYVYLLARKINAQDKSKRMTEVEIAQSEKWYRTLVDTLREGIVYYDTDGIVLFCNKGLCELTGYSTEEILNKSMFDLFIREEVADKYKERHRQRRAGISEEYEDSIRTKNGEYKWVSISAAPVFNDAGEPIAALSTLVDITQKKKQLEDIEAFSSSAAHDLNAPLARIEMIAMLLLDTTVGQLDAESLTLLQAIAGITSNMRSMLKDLLQFSKLGVTGIVKHNVDMAALAQEAVDNSYVLNPKAKVTLQPLPQVSGDGIMLKQVFVNLIGNAFKYSSQKEEPEIEIGTYREGNNNVFFVRDNGAGFSMEQYTKLFAAFQRLHVEFEGNGLGLPIVKRIIEKHGGKLWAVGKEGEGATFYFSLPA